MEEEKQDIEAKKKKLHELIDKIEKDEFINIALEKLNKIKKSFD